LDERFEDISQEFLRDFIGKQTKSPRWKDCQSAVSNRLTYSSGAMYVRKHFRVEDRDAAQEMVGNLREAFKSMLERNEWLSETTREFALKKVSYEIFSSNSGFVGILQKSSISDIW
jgi:putative endopeptidase